MIHYNPEGPRFKLICFCLYLFFLDLISYMNWPVMSSIFLSFNFTCCQLNAMPCENTRWPAVYTRTHGHVFTICIYIPVSSTCIFIICVCLSIFISICIICFYSGEHSLQIPWASANYTVKLPSLLCKAAAPLLLVQAALACSAGKSWGNGLIRFTNGRALMVFAYLTQSEHAS